MGAAALNLEEYKGATGSSILGYIEHETQLFQNPDYRDGMRRPKTASRIRPYLALWAIPVSPSGVFAEGQTEGFQGCHLSSMVSNSGSMKPNCFKNFKIIVEKA